NTSKIDAGAGLEHLELAARSSFFDLASRAEKHHNMLITKDIQNQHVADNTTSGSLKISSAGKFRLAYQPTGPAAPFV
ncbi:MAG: hypothetical protein ACK5KM_12095, partial [Hyphomicrobiaceae bacterium]